jgi:hypothetical protein
MKVGNEYVARLVDVALGSRLSKPLPLGRLRHGVARIDRSRHRARHQEAGVRAAKVKVNQLRKLSAVEEAEYFSYHQRRRCCADKRCSDGLSCEQRNAALIEVAFFEQFLISRLGGERFVLLFRSAPDLGRRSVGGQRVRDASASFILGSAKASAKHWRHSKKVSIFQYVIYLIDRPVSCKRRTDKIGQKIGQLYFRITKSVVLSVY